MDLASSGPNFQNQWFFLNVSDFSWLEKMRCLPGEIYG